jgi:protein TonB
MTKPTPQRPAIFRSPMPPEPGHRRRAAIFALVSTLAHAAVVLALGQFFSPAAVPEAGYTFLVPAPKEVEPPALPPEPEPEAEPEPEVIPSKPPPKPLRAQATPKPEPTPEPQAAPKPRRMLDIDMGATVNAGDGPLVNVGKYQRGVPGGTGIGPGKGGEGDSPTANRAATSVPTAAAKLDRPKRLGQSTQPAYPPQLRAQGIEGNVVVVIDIDKSGAVTQVKVLQSSGYRELDDEAVVAAKRDRYTPAAMGGTPVPYSLKYTYKFRIRGA